MNKEEVKRYLKKHKLEIAFGAACVLVGVKIGKGKFTDDERHLIKTLRTVDRDRNGKSLALGIDEMLNKCTSIIPVIPKSKTGTGTAESFCNYVMQNELKDRNLTGVMLFTKK